MSRHEDDVRAALAALTGTDRGQAADHVRDAARRAGYARLQALAAELAEARRTPVEEGDAPTRPVEMIVNDIRRLRSRMGEPRHQPTDSPSLRDSDPPT